LLERYTDGEGVRQVGALATDLIERDRNALEAMLCGNV
jgi:hypothetical protein